MRISDWSSDVCSSDLFGTLVDEPLSGAKQNRMALLLCRFRIDEAHFRPLSCNHDSLGICRIVLLPLHKRFYVMRRNQLYLMAEPDHLACPIMRAATGFHHDHRR